MKNELESEQWTSYLTFLTAFLAFFTFITFYNINHRIFVFEFWASMLNITINDIPALLSIIALGAFGTIFCRWAVDKIGRKKSLLIFGTISNVFSCFLYYTANLVVFITWGIIFWIFFMNLSSLIISEEVPAKYRTTVSGVVMGVGMCAAITSAGLSTFYYLIPEFWRFSYLMIMIPGIILTLVLGSQMRETRRFVEMKRDPDKKSSHIFSIFKKKYVRKLVLCVLIITSVQLLVLTIKTYFKPFLLSERGFIFTNELVGIMSFLSYFGSMVGYYSSGFLADKMGRKKTLYLASSFYFIGTILFLFTPFFVTIFLGFVLINSFFAIMLVVSDILTVEFFSTKERGLGSGWIYWFASIIPIIGNWLITPLSISITWGLTFFIIGTIGIIAICILPIFLPETKQRVLEEIVATEVDKVGT